MDSRNSTFTRRIIALLKQTTRKPEIYPELSVQVNLVELLDKRSGSIDAFFTSLDQLLLSRGLSLEMVVNTLKASELSLVDFLKHAEQEQLVEQAINHNCSVFVCPKGKRKAVTIESNQGVQILIVE